MEIAQKEKIYGYLFKVILSLILLFCLYNVISILFLSYYGGKTLHSRISSSANSIKINLRRAGPKDAENEIYRSALANKIDGSSRAKPVERVLIFAGPLKTVAEEAEEAVVLYEEAEASSNIEIVFKGLADNLAYINIRREIDGQWYEHGFPTKPGERIGSEKTLGGEKIDFTTNYVLQDIIYEAQRPVTLMKKVVIFNETGKFAGTRMIPGETFMKTTSKIKYKDRDAGVINELWLENPEKLEDKAKSTLSKYGAETE